MLNVYILVGFPASGKSTYAKNLCGQILSSDEIRKELYGNEEEQGNPKEVFDTLYQRMETLLGLDADVIIDATNINRWERSKAIQIANRFSCNIICMCFDVTVEECKKRNANRERKVPDFVYDRMLSKYEEPSYDEGFSYIYKIH